MTKKESRLKRAKKVRGNIFESGRPRLTVHRTPQHIYAQVISADNAETIAAASTVIAEIRADMKHTGNIAAAEKVGQRIAELAVAKGVKEVAFDRSGFHYHGRVKALAEAARKHGLVF